MKLTAGHRFIKIPKIPGFDTHKRNVNDEVERAGPTAFEHFFGSKATRAWFSSFRRMSEREGSFRNMIWFAGGT